MLLIWSIAFGVSIFTFIIGLVKQSWRLLLISSITSLPVVLYFLVAAENNFKYVSFIPLLLFAVTVGLWKKEHRKVISS